MENRSMLADIRNGVELTPDQTRLYGKVASELVMSGLSVEEALSRSLREITRPQMEATDALGKVITNDQASIYWGTYNCFITAGLSSDEAHSVAKKSVRGGSADMVKSAQQYRDCV